MPHVVHPLRAAGNSAQHLLQRPAASTAFSRLAAVATRFSRTVRLGKICRPSGTRPIPSLGDAISMQPWTASPSKPDHTAARAASGPRMARTVVVLPMPLRPISVTSSPAPICMRDAEQHLAQAIAAFHILESRAKARQPCADLLLAEIRLANLRIGADRRPARRTR